jgi:uncharacterized membrane protein
MQATHSVLIEQPVGAVFDLVGDLDNDPVWGALITESRTVARTPEVVGSRYEHVARLLGARITLAIEVTEFERDRRLCYRAADPFPIRHCRTFEETPEGTRLTFVTDVPSSGRFAVAGPLLRQGVQKQMEVDLAAIGAVVSGRV